MTYPPHDDGLYPDDDTSMIRTTSHRRHSGGHRLGTVRRWWPHNRVAQWSLLALIAVVVFVVTFVLATWIKDANEVDTTPLGAPVVTSAPTPRPAPTSPSADLPENAIAGDNATYEVGVDIPAGEYETAGPLDPNIHGTWARSRFRSTSPGTTTPIADGTVTGPTTIAVRVGDVLRVRGMKPLHRVP